MTAELAAAFAAVALANVAREFPRHVSHLSSGPGEELDQRKLHPAFYGSYDWHSAVHMHWLLARLLRLHPELRERATIEEALERHLSAPAIGGELAFFGGPGGVSFERPYGWAWLLELHAELLRLGRWHDAVAPLAAELAGRMRKYLQATPYPVRAGTHGNTAFAATLALDYAHAAGDEELEEAIARTARRWYLDDRSYPVAYEPSGDDFLSPALVEALLMKRALPAQEFLNWIEAFLPADLGPLAQVPRVTDHADVKQSHLDGLCLSRAWCFVHLGKREAAQRHLEAGMPHVMGGDYAGEHWLASFALLALSAEALRTP